MVNQHTPNSRRGHGEEMGAILPIHPRLINHPQVGFIGDRRRLKGVIDGFTPQVSGGEHPQFVVNQGHQTIGSPLVAGGQLFENGMGIVSVVHISSNTR